jgi:hypothetical protein
MKNTQKKTGILVMVTKDEKENIELKAKNNGFNSVSEYIRVMAINGTVVIK